MTYLDQVEGNARAGGSVRVAELTFVEQGAGTYTGEIDLPAGATVLDVQVHGIALWTAATSASLNVGDNDPDGFYAAVNLKATDLLAGESLTFAAQGGKGGAYLTAGSNTHFTNLYRAAARTITAAVVSVGAGTAGRTRVLVLYTVPTSTQSAAFVEEEE